MTANRAPISTTRNSGSNGDLRVDVLHETSSFGSLAADVRSGLLASPKVLAPKYFYDDHGSALFDAICDLPEYYLTRIGQALLTEHAEEIVALTAPHEIVELGCGTARKTRVLLDVLERRAATCRYVPIDVSEGTLRRAAASLLNDYPDLGIHALVGDYERDLERLPAGTGRLVLFLGSTIGNFGPAESTVFLARLRRQLAAGEHLLLGVDLVKAVEVIEAAYNDRAGVTAEFNRNVLHVINRHLDADFRPERFEHVAFFNRTASQIEMHLRAPTPLSVSIRALDMTVSLAAGETIQTEISRKFTKEGVAAMLGDSGFDLTRWYTPSNNFFALALARAA
jgi:L-histidine N-alpha-methyltransferase